jgi:hypothetical protein
LSRRCEEFEPSERQREIARAAKLAVWVCEMTGKECDPDVINAANHRYPEECDTVAYLCGLIKKLTKKQFKEIVYNAKPKESRRLADWWEDHQEKDKRREIEEDKERRRLAVINKALNKLTPKEKELLGIFEPWHN